MALDDDIDRLYGLPLEEFTAARNELAAALRKDGKREDSERVKALRKPSTSAWAVNQLARRERMQVRSLATSAERLRKAQAGLLRGGDAQELRASVERQREVVNALVKRAQQLLREGGHPSTDATMERVRGTLTAVAGNEEGAKLVEQGRLEADLDPAGFGPMTGAPPPTQKTKGSRRKAAVEQAKRKVDELRAELREREESARRAAGALGRAEHAAKAAKAAAEKEEAALEKLSARLDEAKEALERARSS